MGNPGSASASRMTFMAGNAIKGAAQAALAKWEQAEERPAIAEYTYLAPKTTPFDKETGYAMPNLSYAYVAQAVEVEVDTGNRFYQSSCGWSPPMMSARPSTRGWCRDRSRARWCRPRAMP